RVAAFEVYMQNSRAERVLGNLWFVESEKTPQEMKTEIKQTAVGARQPFLIMQIQPRSLWEGEGLSRSGQTILRKIRA
ncbi:MAG: hypothetical protein ACREC0_09625, partial [Methylocella sp.]